MPANLAVLGDDPVVGKSRAPEAETVGRVRVSYWDDTREYQTGTSEFVLADDNSQATSQVELPITLRPGQGEILASRWLVSARVSRDELKIALPTAQQQIVPGDVIKLDDDTTGATYRVERIEEQGARAIEAVRVEQDVYKQKDASSPIGTIGSVNPARSVLFRFLDLPLLPSSQSSIGPHLVATASPWPTGVAAYLSASDDGYVLNTVLETPTQMGRTLNAVNPSCIGRWENNQSIEVKVSHGALQSRSELDVLNGANVAVIGDGSSAGWEVFQYRDAELLGDGTYRLSGLLRGQVGSDAEMVAPWPVGSEVVFLRETPTQLQLNDSDRGLERYVRVGPANKPVSDPSYQTKIESFDLLALRPLSPVHVSVEADPVGLILRWIRRTRIDGDSWQGLDVPLGEATEQYEVVVFMGSTELRREMVSEREWEYRVASQLADGAAGDIRIEISQISERFGAGAPAVQNVTL